MASYFEGIQKRARAFGKTMEEMGAKAGKAIDDAVQPTVKAINSSSYQKTKSAEQSQRIRRRQGYGKR